MTTNAGAIDVSKNKIDLMQKDLTMIVVMQ